MNDLPQILIPKILTREFIRTQRGKLNFIYGDAFSNRHNYFGQCAEAKGETNTFVVYTKWSPCTNSPPTSFFDDKDFERMIKPIIDDCISCIPRTLPIILFPKIGLGCAKMKEKCPKTYNYLINQLNYLAYPNVKIDYNL